MAFGSAHPALYSTGYHCEGVHFVPEGWEATSRGICPCGEAVRWDEDTERWLPDRSLRVFVLTETETLSLWTESLATREELRLQNTLNQTLDVEDD